MSRLTGCAAVLASLTMAAPVAAQRADAQLRQAMLVAEDSRARTADELAPLYQGLASRDAEVAAMAVRAIGRLERPALLSRVLPFVADPRPAVRSAAAFAVAQIGQDTSVAAGAAPILLDRLGQERDPTVIAALARSVGRLPYRSPDRARAAELTLAGLGARPIPAAQMVEVARGAEAFVRLGGAAYPRQPELLNRLRMWAVAADDDLESAARIRRAAVAALANAAAPDPTLLARLAGDPDEEVRRLGVIWAGDSTGVEARRDYLAEALLDRSPMVRVEALRVWGRRFQPTDCDPLVRAMRDPGYHVTLQAIQLLGNPCPASAGISDVLWPLVDSLAGSQRASFVSIANWHRGAAALIALARIDPNRAKSVLSRAGASLTWQVRMYAARAAGIIGDQERLLTLSEDPNDNVREATLAGLLRVRGHAVDSVFRNELGRSDYQLIISASRALAGTPHRQEAAAALAAALTRVTDDRRDTARDPRLAILERLAEVGGPAHAPALEPLLEDYDPVVAAAAARLLTQWTGVTRRATPQPLAPTRFDWSAIDGLRGMSLRVTMASTSGGGVFEIELDPDLAPVSVARLVKNATAGYYDGLTFHRVVANFVIQGGSPRANEYAGDVKYLRDEVGPLSHERGTVGISTRGRDTGDAQIFVNLVDNLRLDFDYTVVGRVTRGLDVVDAILEGDVIDRIDLVDAGAARRQP
ncbi:MAG: peptidylprolyl isomerase [Gemmatimonadales bacterium]